MSRSGYSDECENIGLWRGTVRRALQGKRGQAFLREMAAAMDAMPVKELIAHEITSSTGGVCAIGTVAGVRGMDVSNLDEGDPDEVATAFGVAPAMVKEIAYVNDEMGQYRGHETPADRWRRVRAWVQKELAQ